MSGRYDAFLSYNREDVEDVRTIYEFLSSRGLKVWFDAESINFGDDWMDKMQEGLTNSRNCLIFCRDSLGPWHKEEVKEAIRRKTSNPEFKVILVLLPGAKDVGHALPLFLQGSNWVDLSQRLFNMPVLNKLVQAIQGGTTIPIHPVPDVAPKDKDLPTGYKADVNKIISLLIGESLYKQKYVCIREIIQNAVDACERRFKVKSGLRVQPRITVLLNSKEGFFEVQDNGDGMTSILLSECFGCGFFLTTGKR